MAIKLLVVFAVVCAAKQISSFKIESRIIRGHDAQPHVAPYMVSIQNRMSSDPEDYHHSCGGTILDEHWVLTAAHCVNHKPDVFYMRIQAGRHNITAKESTAQQRNVDYHKIHAKYDGGADPNDLALIYTKEPFVWTDEVQPVKLPTPGKQHKGKVTLYGWGIITEGLWDPVFPDILQTTELPLIPNDQCVELLHATGFGGEPIDNTNICTMTQNGSSGCNSDSGGPLVMKQVNADGKVQDELVGVVSWGPKPCGHEGNPEVYVRVSSFIDWIQDVRN